MSKQVSIMPTFPTPMDEAGSLSYEPSWYRGLKYDKIRVEYNADDKTKVLVIDNGTDFTHVSLVEFNGGYVDFTDSKPPYGSHSTHVSSTISSSDFYGLTNSIEVVSYKTLNSITGSGTIDDIVDAINEADRLDIKIINMSLGSQHPDSKLREAVENYLRFEDRFIVAAAGNDGYDIDYPAAWADDIPNLICVTSAYYEYIEHDPALSKAYLSHFSSVEKGRSTVAYQGQAVRGALVTTNTDKNPTALMDGTSMAAPGITALIALASSMIDNLTYHSLHFLFSISCVPVYIRKRDHRRKQLGDILDSTHIEYGFVMPYDFLVNAERLAYSFINPKKIKKGEKAKLPSLTITKERKFLKTHNKFRIIWEAIKMLYKKIFWN